MQFLFVDRILQLSPGESIKGLKHITMDDYYLTTDENGDLVFIPSLIGETLGQLAAWNVMFSNGFTKRPVAGIAASAKLFRSAKVNETLLLESWIDRLDHQLVQYHSVASINNEPVFSLEGALGPLLPMEDFIAREEVERQFLEINQPGEWPPVVSRAGEYLIDTNNRPGPLLRFDRIVDIEPQKSMVAEKCISRAAPWFKDHFPRKPVLPMTALMECKINLARAFVDRSNFPVKYVVKELRKIKMNDFIQPGDIVSCTLLVKSQTPEELILSFRSEVMKKRVCLLEMLLRVE